MPKEKVVYKLTKYGGYCGKILRINLTSGKINKEDLPDSLLRKFIGGNGLGINYLYKEVKKNHLLLVDDGLIELRALKISGKDIYCKVLNSGVIMKNKGINVPDAAIKINPINTKAISATSIFIFLLCNQGI